MLPAKQLARVAWRPRCNASRREGLLVAEAALNSIALGELGPADLGPAELGPAELLSIRCSDIRTLIQFVLRYSSDCTLPVTAPIIVQTGS